MDVKFEQMGGSGRSLEVYESESTGLTFFASDTSAHESEWGICELSESQVRELHAAITSWLSERDNG